MTVFLKKAHDTTIAGSPLRLVLAGLAMVFSLNACGQPQQLDTPRQPTVLPVETADLDVTTKVIHALSRDDMLMIFDIQVKTVKGDVSLTGAVDNQMQIDRALQLARNISGVVSVNNKLTLNP